MAKGEGGGAVLRKGRHIDNECMRSMGRIRKAVGEGGGAVRFRSGEGGAGCCLLQVRYVKYEMWEGGGALAVR